MPKFLAGITQHFRRFNRKRSYAPESMFSDLVAGDYIVHSEYGVGKFLGWWSAQSVELIENI